MQRLINSDSFAKTKKRAVVREPMRCAKEVASMFGYKNISSLWSSVASNCFPEPDLLTGGISGNHKRAYWRLSTLKKEELRRGKAH